MDLEKIDLKNFFNNHFEGEGVSDEIISDIEQLKDSSKLVDVFIHVQKGYYWQKKDFQKVLEMTESVEKILKKRGEVDLLFLSLVFFNFVSFTLPWWSDSLEISDEFGLKGLEYTITLLDLREKNKDTDYKLGGA